MARLNVYVSDELAELARAAGVNVSALTQSAIKAELDRKAIGTWLDTIGAQKRVTHSAAMAALDAAREEFGSRNG